MSTTAQATAAPKEVTIGGRRFKMSPLNFKAIGELEQAFQDEYLAENNRMIARMEVSEAEKAALRQQGMQTAHMISMTTTDPYAMKVMEQKCTTPRGMARLFVASCRPDHPDLTVEDVVDMFDDMANIQAAQIAFEQINNPEQEQKKTSRQSRKKGRKKKSR